MNWKSFGFGILTTILVLLTVGGAMALLGTDSTKIDSVTIQDNLDADVWWIVDAYTNTDGTVTHCTTQPQALAVVERNYLSKDYPEQVLDEDLGLVDNPESRRAYTLRTGIGEYHRDNYLAGEMEEYQAGKPTHDFE